MMAEEIKGRHSSSSQQRHAARKNARNQLFLKGPVTFNWMCSHIPDATSRLILVARAFVDIQDSPRIKLTRKRWESAGITDKDTRSRVIAKIKRECPGILLDTQKGRCTYIDFKPSMVGSCPASACREARQQSTHAPSDEAPCGSLAPWQRSHAASQACPW